MKVVDDDNFAILHYVLNIALVKRMCALIATLDVVFHVPVFWVGNVADAQQTFDSFPSLRR